MDNFSTRTFQHDYPNNPYIDAEYVSGNRIFYSKYKIIALGYYPQNVKYTKKSKNGTQYQIPDEYIVKTEVADRMLHCKTKYISANKVLFTIKWKEDKAEWEVSSERSSSGVISAFFKKINREESKLSGIFVFGFDIEILHQERIKKLQKLDTENIIIDKRKRPLNELSTSQQNKRLISFGQDAHQKINQLILKQRLTSESGKSIRICNIELETENKIINLKYNLPVDITKLDALVRAHDEALLDEDYNNSDGILVDEHEIGNGAYQSIKSLLQILIPIWKNSNPPVLQIGDIIKLKLGGDRRNVGRKQNHVMMTICLLNEKDNVLKPDHQYCICLFVGKEKYDTLEKVAHIFNDQLSELQENGIYDNDNIHWKIEFFFSADWKFMYIIMGLNAPNSKYFCLYCDCELNNRWNMNLQWIINKNTKGQKKPALFPVIKQENYIPDELHLLLRISDVLMECFFNDLFKKKEFEQQIKNQVEQVMKDIKIHFEFFKSKSNGGKWNWTSLMGPDKKKILQNFPITQFISGKRGEDIQKLWHDFYELYNILRKPFITNSEINNLKIKAKEWINLFCRPNQGQMNSPLQKN
ncbi:hypothetical protein Glove_30g8 [Diversispora epigaea]|uniref:Uncharacterized protein n=1 Tax=Diversispora epigaea TaxID=1348612 RepID=A0A397JHK4_9GLOM|nr:hypothetical protein Glove_30g8 [Diversispora epigaea]